MMMEKMRRPSRLFPTVLETMSLTVEQSIVLIACMVDANDACLNLGVPLLSSWPWLL